MYILLFLYLTLLPVGVLESEQSNPEHHHPADREDSGCHGRRTEGVHSPYGSADAPPLPTGLQ